jgi:hypothetical protein
MGVSQIRSPAMSQKSMRDVKFRQPILSSHLQFEMDYLNGDSREYLLEWYPLYINDVAVPPPLSRVLSKQEKQDRLELIHQAISDTSVYTLSIASLCTTVCLTVFVLFLLTGILFLLTGILFLVWTRKQYVWLIVWLYIILI